MHRMEDFAAQGLYPWTMFRDNGEIERTRQEVEWLRRVVPRTGPGRLGQGNRAS
jgi:hypothetical protein